MTFVEFVIGVHDRLDEAGLPHAFGGALALAYVAEPRATVDVDVNVFHPMEGAAKIVAALAQLGLQPEQQPERWVPVAGIRLHGPYPVDLFPSLDERYAEIEQRCVTRSFGPAGVALPFLSAEDVALFKLSFGRDKDWVDLRSIAQAQPDLDLDYIERQLIGLRGPTMYPRIARLRQLLRR